MKINLPVLIPILLLFNSCYGPALSQKYVCKDEQDLHYRKPDWSGYQFFCLMNTFSPESNQSISDETLLMCLIYTEYKKNEQCADESSSIPWWIE